MYCLLKPARWIVFKEISTLGWVIMIGMAVFILALNLGLFLGIKQKARKDNWIDKLSDAGQVLKHPLKKENDQYQALSNQVARYKKEDSQQHMD